MTETGNSNQTNKLDIRLSDLATAASILTRFPLRPNWVDPTRLAASAWSFPLIGALIGVLGGILLSFLIYLGFSAGISSVLALGLMIFMTGGLHEDGIADCADGLGGGSSKERALEIMKDSRLGAFGAIVLTLFLIGRWSAITELAPIAAFSALVLVGTASRCPVVFVMFGMKNARESGLSKQVGRPGVIQVTLAFALTALICLIFMSWWGIILILFVLISGMPLLFFASRKIGGQTGDILGGIQQCAEVAALAFLTMIWT